MPSLPSFTAFELSILSNLAVFVLTLVFAQKIKDFFTGVPADLRSGLSAIEANVKADVKKYQAEVIAKVTPAPAPVVKAPVAPAVVATAAPAAPAAPAA